MDAAFKSNTSANAVGVIVHDKNWGFVAAKSSQTANTCDVSRLICQSDCAGRAHSIIDGCLSITLSSGIIHECASHFEKKSGTIASGFDKSWFEHYVWEANVAAHEIARSAR